MKKKISEIVGKQSGSLMIKLPTFDNTQAWVQIESVEKAEFIYKSLGCHGSSTLSHRQWRFTILCVV